MTAWTAEEDVILVQQVETWGAKDQWRRISEALPGRTNKACRKRWLHSLSPDIKKSLWTQEEDHLLLQMHAQFPGRWALIARGIPGRTDDACSKRYRESLDPNLRKDEWTEEEDALLLAEVARNQSHEWTRVGTVMNRSSLSCRNRYRMLQRKKPPQFVSPPALHIDPTLQQQPLPLQVPLEQPQQEQQQQQQPLSPPQEMAPEDLGQEDMGHDDMGQLDLEPYVEPLPHEQDPLVQVHWQPDPADLPPVPTTWTPGYAFGAFAHMPRHPVAFEPMAGPSRLPDIPEQHFAIDPNLREPEIVHQSHHHHQHHQQYMAQSTISPASSGSPDTPEAQPYYHTQPYVVDPTQDHDDQPAAWDYEQPDPYIAPPEGMDADDTPLDDGSPGEHVHEEHAAPSLPLPPPMSRSMFQPPAPAFTPFNAEVPKRKYTKRKRPDEDDTDPRLSASRNVTSGADVLAYVCGFTECWQAADREKTAGLANSPAGVRFANSAALLAHRKALHADEEVERMFRCGLENCGKSWKNINGIQYHLQVSRAHFKHAVDDVQREKALADEEKKYRCKIPGCTNSYRQASGLRYHMKTGHPQDEPTQIPELPPQIRRKLGTS